MIIRIIGIGLILVGLIILIIECIFCKKNNNIPSDKINNGNYAFLIPARYESKVIEGLLNSIDNQTRKVPSKNVYVIVESTEDPTVEIVKKHKMNIVYRHDLSKKRKGYALDDAIKEIINKNIHYDAYFVMDADNVLDRNFLKEMEKLINKGYDIGLGYRNCKNGNDSVVAACSSLTFSMINEFSNNKKIKDTRTLTISGTGFFIRGDIIESLGGYPFLSLTEDYELTLYAVLNNLTTSYNTKAIFYDEQPTSYSKTIVQRTRWIRGYFEARRKYIGKIKASLVYNDKNFGSKITEIVGVKHYIFMITGAVLYFLSDIINILKSGDLIFNIVSMISLLLLVYIILFLFTKMLLGLEKDKLNLTKEMRIKALFFNPIYLIGYVRCALIALFKKDVGWDVIEHNRNI